jgi:hypothetical protein
MLPTTYMIHCTVLHHQLPEFSLPFHYRKWYISGFIIYVAFLKSRRLSSALVLADGRTGLYTRPPDTQTVHTPRSKESSAPPLLPAPPLLTTPCPTPALLLARRCSPPRPRRPGPTPARATLPLLPGRRRRRCPNPDIRRPHPELDIYYLAPSRTHPLLGSSSVGSGPTGD